MQKQVLHATLKHAKPLSWLVGFISLLTLGHIIGSDLLVTNHANVLFIVIFLSFIFIFYFGRGPLTFQVIYLID